ncbi:hypothetical protein BRADI_4g04222v3 [Brachypodium distachyon]|uniref:Uncharacterized protein n=1 Tax=Brachypodium distachyon TaxID=15368 RepID=A0A2K2CKD9_BRADI|nr:hypothetical protein BRADI_4g04222v3 [Brachypodium distachyon]
MILTLILIKLENKLESRQHCIYLLIILLENKLLFLFQAYEGERTRIRDNNLNLHSACSICYNHGYSCFERHRSW